MPCAEKSHEPNRAEKSEAEERNSPARQYGLGIDEQRPEDEDN